MQYAFKLWSWMGYRKEQVRATAIKSQSDARKLGPFVDEDGYPLTWVNWSRKNPETSKKKRAHFRHYPQGRIKTKHKYNSIDEEIEDKEKISESNVHKKARTELKKYLQKLINENKGLSWAFKDEKQSDFPLKGNLLADVEQVETPYRYCTPFGLNYEYDLALLGPKLNKEPIILGVIELEKTHKYGFLKLLTSKCLGFPLISINLEALKEEDIDEEWCKNAIEETTNNSEDNLRRNYIYIHNVLFPVYLDISSNTIHRDKHQFIIFCKDEDYEKLFLCLNKYKKILGFNDEKTIHIHRVQLNENNRTSLRMFKNEGSIAGSDWNEYNDKRYLRVTTDIPFEKSGPLYQYHLVMARLLNTHFQTLVGYKYSKGLNNTEINNPLWTSMGKNIAPKAMSEPVYPIIEHLKEFGIINKVLKKPSVVKEK